MAKVVNVGVFLPLHKGLRYMVTIILLVLMLLSGAFGFLMRKQRPLIRIAGQTITYVVYVLLLVMGVVLGKNDELFAKLPSVGLQSLVITVFALAGTILFAWLFGRYVMGARGRKPEPSATPSTPTPEALSTPQGGGGMKKILGSLSFLGIFLVGVVLGHFFAEHVTFITGDIIEWLLYALMICVGTSTGGEEETLRSLRGMGVRPLLLPIFTVVGTALGVLLALPFFSDLTLKDVQLVGAGYAYYSLSSVIISAEYSELIAAVALVSNIIRELSTIMLAPLYVRLGGVYAPICTAGATSMDTVLPFILRATSPQYAVVSVYHGIVLTFFVPFAVAFALLLP